MRTRIYFVRHAEAQSNANPDFDASKGALDNLTEKGQSQAVQLARRFQHIPVEAIYSSVILRAELTAKEIGIVTGLESKILPYIKEIKGSFPDKFLFKNVPEDVMIEEVRKIVHHPIWLLEMDETFDSFKSRIVELKNFLESLEYKHVVVVSHAI
jgi:broad specificity phosphatase PhoE